MNSPYLAACQPFVYGKFLLFEGKHYSINGAEVEDYFDDIRKDLDNLYRAFYFCEMADYLTAEGNDELAIMQLLYVSLQALRKGSIPPELVQVIYELKILALFGWMLETSQCVVCHRTMEQSYSFRGFSTESGGLVCKECIHKLRSMIPVLESTVYTLQFIMSQPVSRLYHFTVSKEVLENLQEISRLYLKKQVNHSFKSLEFLNC